MGPELDKLIVRAAERFRTAGRKVYNWDRSVVKAKAAVSYALCMAELADQMVEQRIEPAAAYICSGGSTGAGMTLASED